MQTDSLSWVWKKSDRRKHMAIQIDDKGVVSLCTPSRTSQSKADQLLRDKMSWILKSKKIQEARIHPCLPEFSESGNLYFLGESFPFTLDAKAVETIVCINDAYIIKAKNKTEFHKHLKLWYKKQSETLVAQALDIFVPRALSKPLSIGFKVYKRRWGSCTHDNQLMFNTLLSLRKPEHIHYVVAHELAHIKVKNHSLKFYAEGEKILKGFRALDKQMRV